MEIYDYNFYYHFTFLKCKILRHEDDIYGISVTYFEEKSPLIVKKNYYEMKLQEYDNIFDNTKDEEILIFIMNVEMKLRSIKKNQVKKATVSKFK